MPKSRLTKSVTAMVQQAMQYIDEAPDVEAKTELIKTLNSVSAGKIYVEIERARLIKILAKIKEQQGNIAKAADLMQEVAVLFIYMDRCVIRCNKQKRYLAVPPPDTMQQAKKIDEEILQEVLKMGFDRSNLVESLRNRVQNEGTVAYYLLLDNRFRVSSGYLGAEFQESMDGFNRMSSNEPASPIIVQRIPGYVDYQGTGVRPQFHVDMKWALGLQSRANPRDLMIEVLKALQELNVGWKKIGHYNMKCRWIPGTGHHEGMVNNSMHSNHYFGDEFTIIESDGATRLPNMVKFEVQCLSPPPPPPPFLVPCCVGGWAAV